jgi:NAD(P)H-hydrate epimerase
MRIVSTEEMKQIETETIEHIGFNERMIIENVGIRAAEVLSDRWADSKESEICFFIGKGNNGADGLAVARHLKRKGFQVRGFQLFSDEECSQEHLFQRDLAKQFGVRISKITDVEQLKGFFNHGQDQFFIVDAIFGTGVRLPLSNAMYEVIKMINQFSDDIVALDMPSGVTGDGGETQGGAIRANLTLAIAFPKVGHYIFDGPTYSGKVQVVDAGFPQAPSTEGGNKFLLQTKDAIYLRPERSKFGHKNTFGHTLVIGGSAGLTGALVLASNAALKVGTGLVTGMTWEDCYMEFVASSIPEVMKRKIDDDISTWERQIEKVNLFDSVVVGPGLGQGEKARKLVLDLLQEFQGPMVIDADGINVLNLDEDKAIIASRKYPTLLTPHLGEYARLTGEDKEAVRAKPIDSLRSLVAELNCGIALKGPTTFLAFPAGNILVNNFPNDGMATGGVGDVLAGIFGGLFSQDTGFQSMQFRYTDPEYRFEKAVSLGMLIHTLTGKHAREQLGQRFMTSGSLIEFLPQAFAEIRNLSQENFE